MPIENRLKRDDIFVIAIAKRSNMKNLNVTVNDILRPIIDELHELEFVETQIMMFLKNKSSKTVSIRAVLASLVGDNLGIYELLGYVQTFGLGFTCRFCGTDYSTIQTETNFDLLQGNTLELEYSNILSSIKVCCRNRRFKESLRGKKLSSRELKNKANKDCAQKNRFGSINECSFFEVS